MANLFLDTNVFIDLLEKRPYLNPDSLLNHALYISPLSPQILAYTYKYKMPHSKLKDSLSKDFNVVILDQALLLDAVDGPTSGFEDNIQLHSAAQANCDYFITRDEGLLHLAYFGKMKISDKITD